MPSKLYTFWELLSDKTIAKGIEIPMIQRDYAQGRNKPDVKEIRSEFLEDIRRKAETAISDPAAPKLELDFVYGSIEGQKFIPLDGQQRLTTLFLLHWYLALRDRQLTEHKLDFGKFYYQTRATSREFCRQLSQLHFSELSYQRVFSQEGAQPLSRWITDQAWFFLSWKQDPTIASMLVMLDAIHKRFSNSPVTFKALTDPQLRLISFHYLPIQTYGRSDGLYIKMNARGKVLTKFENFKAKFENFIAVRHHYLLAEFTRKIDGIWSDLIWEYSKENIQDDKETGLIDGAMLHYLYFVSEMLFYRSGFDQKMDFDTRFQTIEFIYEDARNLIFLYRALDVFALVGTQDHRQLITDFFQVSFSARYEPGKVALFETDINLLDKCISGRTFEIKDKLLLYAIIYYFCQQTNWLKQRVKADFASPSLAQ